MNRRRQLLNLITERVFRLLNEETFFDDDEDTIKTTVENINSRLPRRLKQEGEDFQTLLMYYIENFSEFVKDIERDENDNPADVHDYTVFISNLSDEDFVNMNMDFKDFEYETAPDDENDTEEDELEQLESEIEEEDEF